MPIHKKGIQGYKLNPFSLQAHVLVSLLILKLRTSFLMKKLLCLRTVRGISRALSPLQNL